MATKRPSRGWWNGWPAPIRIGIELGGGYVLASTLSRFLGPAFAGFEVVVVALVVAGIARALGKLAMIEDFPSLRTFFDWYSPSIGSAIATPPFPPQQPPQRPQPPAKVPDISGFFDTREVMLRLQQLAKNPVATGKTHLPGAIIALLGPKGTGKSDIAHAWAASLLKGGVRTKELRIISRTRLPGLVSASGPSEGALHTLREEAEAALDGILLIDDLDCLIPRSSDPHAPVDASTALTACATHRFF